MLGLENFQVGWSIAKKMMLHIVYIVISSSQIEQAGGDCFVGQGFKNWKKNEKFRIHVGKINSAHNQARRMCKALQNQEQHVEIFFTKQSNQARSDYRMR